MNTIKITELEVDTVVKTDLFIDEKFILLPGKTSFSKEIIDRLKEWQFTELLCAEKVEVKKDEPNIQPIDSIGDIKIEQLEIEPKKAPHIPTSKTVVTEVSVDDFLSDSPKTSSAPKPEIPTSPKPVSDTEKPAVSSPVKPIPAVAKPETKEVESSPEDEEKFIEVEKEYQNFSDYINYLFTRYATHKTISIEEITEKVQKLCKFVKENKRHVLRVTPSAEMRKKNFLVIHSMKSTVLAITLGYATNLPQEKVVELGIASILHEIGMLHLPPQLYMSDRKLTENEKAQISMHSLYSFNIVKECKFPLSIQLGVLDHHEKVNGQGYPRHLKAEKISNYAKIIAVACSFEAITAPRTYKTERTTFDAMVEMLHNPNGQYDATVIKALLYSLSLYPIGAYVYLNNGKIGLVTDVLPNNPKNPIVQILNEKNPDGSPKTIQSDENANKILRVLTKHEQEDLLKTLDSN